MSGEEQYDETFESADSGAAMTYPMCVGDVKKGGHMNINGRPCKVITQYNY
jgi:translation initiation factor 5A